MLEINANFTPSQARCLDALDTFVNSPTDFEFTISGFAGTGKTYIINHFIKVILNNSKECVVTAPTHRALREIEKRTNVKGMTLHALHGLRPNVDLPTFDINKLSFESLGAVKMSNYKIMIVDEASMINKSLFALNRQRAKTYGCKIIYLGDKYQLPPVNEQVASAFTQVSNNYNLLEIVRQDENNSILKLTQLLRNDIESKGNSFLTYISKHRTNINSEDNGYIITNRTQYKELLDYHFTEGNKFFKDVNHVRSTAFMNNTVGNWNLHLRELLFSPKDVIIINDLLTAYKTIVDDNNASIITNSEDYIIHQIRPYKTEKGFKVFAVVLKNIVTKELTSMIQILDHNDATNLEVYIQHLTNLRNNAKAIGGRKGWYPYFKFKQQILCLKDIDISEIHNQRDIDYGYCITTHKLQGATFKNIFVDGQDICSPISKRGFKYKQDLDLRNRLLYVAISRASSKAIINF